VFAGGSYEEVGRWLLGFLNSHAKRESPRAEGILEAGRERTGRSFGVRLRLGDRYQPPLDRAPVELSFPEVSEGKGSFGWCESRAERVRAWTRELLDAEAHRVNTSV
jgi:hypothetical protein